MEEGSESTRFWCHECSRAVETIMEAEMIKCSLCHGGFVEDLDSARSNNHNHRHAGDSESDRALSLWDPILVGMTNNPRRRRRFRQIENHENDENGYHNREEGDSELDPELNSIMRRRRRSSATILHLLQGIRAGMITEPENIGERDRDRVILINPLNQTIIVQGGGGGGGSSFDSGGGPSQNHQIGSLGDYFVGPGFELLLQHLAENDPNRYGTPPALKEAVEAMRTVSIGEGSVQCWVCLEDFEVGNEAKEMPCKHRFHGECILPWLELHSSCPVCRYQLPSSESKLENYREVSGGITASRGSGSGEEGEDGPGRNARRFSVALPWPFSSLFSSTSGTQVTNPHLIMHAPGSGSRPTGHEGGEGAAWREDDH